MCILSVLSCLSCLAYSVLSSCGLHKSSVFVSCVQSRVYHIVCFAFVFGVQFSKTQCYFISPRFGLIVFLFTDLLPYGICVTCLDMIIHCRRAS